MAINQNKGFAMTFENRWTISVQWGPGNYGSNRRWGDDVVKDPDPMTHNRWQGTSAEICVWDPDGDIVLKDLVMGWISPDDVAHYVNRVSKYHGDRRAKDIRWRVLK
jgi:hypothetical protein